MSTEPKDGTKNVPPPTEDEDHGRVTADTVVAEGPNGMKRMRRILHTLMPSHRRQE